MTWGMTQTSQNAYNAFLGRPTSYSGLGFLNDPNFGAPQDDGGGGYDDGGDALNAQIEAQQIAADKARLDAGYKDAGNVITQSDAQLRQRFASLQAEQVAAVAASAAKTGADAKFQLQAYKAATAPVNNDLQAQGFSAAPLQQQAAFDQSAMYDKLATQNTLSQNLQAVQQRSFADRQANADLVTAGARGTLQTAYLAALADLNGSGGGGGGGGGGYGGSGSSAALPAGVAADLATASDAPFAPGNAIDGAEQGYSGSHARGANALLHAALYGGMGHGHINNHGGNSAQVEADYGTLLRAKFGGKVSHKTLNRMLGTLHSEMKTVRGNRKALNSRRHAKHKANQKLHNQGY